MFSTTSLIQHLKNQHIEFTQVTRAKAASKQHALEEEEDAFKRREKFPRDRHKAKKITERVIEFITLDDQPITVVENKGFCQLLEPEYTLPSRRPLQTLPKRSFTIRVVTTYEVLL